MRLLQSRRYPNFSPKALLESMALKLVRAEIARDSFISWLSANHGARELERPDEVIHPTATWPLVLGRIAASARTWRA
jgi:hypothetical protein